jgi:hypothetical protein
MRTTPTRAPEPDLICLAIAGGWLALEAAAALLIALAALLLTLAGWRPAAPAVRLAPAPLPVVLTPAPTAPLERLTVRELRARARAAGLPQLARRGRRSELLEALA